MLGLTGRGVNPLDTLRMPPVADLGCRAGGGGATVECKDRGAEGADEEGV